MIQSMTGYGKAEGQFADHKTVVEIRSVNSKQLDLTLKLNNAVRDNEQQVRALLQKPLERGKVGDGLAVVYALDAVREVYRIDHHAILRPLGVERHFAAPQQIAVCAVGVIELRAAHSAIAREGEAVPRGDLSFDGFKHCLALDGMDRAVINIDVLDFQQHISALLLPVAEFDAIVDKELAGDNKEDYDRR